MRCCWAVLDEARAGLPRLGADFTELEPRAIMGGPKGMAPTERHPVEATAVEMLESLYRAVPRPRH